MANKTIVGFEYRFKGDGMLTEQQCDFASKPVLFSIGSYKGTDAFAGTPTEVFDLSVDGGLTISSMVPPVISAGVLTITFTGTPANGTVYLVTGKLAF